MDALQRSLPLGHGRVHWETLPAEVRAKVLEFWIELLMGHEAEEESGEGREERGDS